MNNAIGAAVKIVVFSPEKQRSLKAAGRHSNQAKLVTVTY